MAEQTQWHPDVEGNAQNQNRERNQRGKDDDVWRITDVADHWLGQYKCFFYSFTLTVWPANRLIRPVTDGSRCGHLAKAVMTI